MKTIFSNLLKKADIAYSKYSSICDEVCVEAQKYVNWANLRWEYVPGDGLCFGIIGEYALDVLILDEINDLTLVPAEEFFYIVNKKGKVSPDDFYHSKI